MFTTFNMRWLGELLKSSSLLQPIIKDHTISKYVFRLKGGGEIEIHPGDVRMVQVHIE